MEWIMMQEHFFVSFSCALFAAAAAAFRLFRSSFHTMQRLNALEVMNRETVEAMIPYANNKM